YQPAIAITKVNNPTAVRGDLTPPAQVVSTYVVTNPGNDPLSAIQVTDNRCAPVTPVPTIGPNVGDVNGDLRLDVGEAWQYSCVRNTVVSRTRGAAPTNILNTVTVTGTDPNETTVSATAQDDVDVYFPGISVTKLVNGQSVVTVAQGTPVTY